MKTMRQKQVYSTIRNIIVLTFIISGCSGFIQAFFNCSYYTFHENSAKGRSWETSRFLCQNSSEGDLVSIEEEEERNFVKNIIKNLTTIIYFIGLKKDNGKWKWLSNQTTVKSSLGQSPWAPGQPSWTPYRKDNCATIYGKYRRYLGRFSDLSCSLRSRYSGHICERAVSCTKHERDPHATKERQKVTQVHSTTRTPWKAQPFPSTAEIDSIVPGTSLTKKPSQVPPVHSTTRTSSQGQPSSHFKAEIKSTVSSGMVLDTDKPCDELLIPIYSQPKTVPQAYQVRK
ncbi:uncharacterized protein LOC141887090 isoform X5 [Acropora palmata]|uniref:uncharacterized protein LOC141887090 isoform X5 n=1 Tax=Acropora palmata TaxID=6131 RepID=UPI003DA0840F